MGEKKKERPTPKPETKADKKTSETVHLSAEELRKISGGLAPSIIPPEDQQAGHGELNERRSRLVSTA